MDTLKNRATVAEVAKRIALGATIALVLPDSPDAIVTGSALALARHLARQEKIASMFVPPMLKKNPAFSNASEEPLREFIISFDLARSPIKELKYERGPNRLNIILSPSGPVRREDVQFAEGPLLYDLVIAIGIQNVGDAAEGLARAPELLYEKPILNIGSRPDAGMLGEINLLPGPGETLPELIWALSTELGPGIQDPESLSALFGALAAATKNFSPAETGAKAYALAGTLLELGAERPALAETPSAGALPAPVPRPASSLSESQLCARAVVRSRLDQDSTLWSLLTREDFARTGTDSSAIPAVLPRLGELLPAHARAILFWQDPADGRIRTLAAFRDQNERERAFRHPRFLRDNPLSSVADTAQTFPEAEMKISQLLRELGTVE